MASLPRPSEQSSSSDHRLNYQSTSLRYNQEIKAALEVKTVVPMPSSRGGGDGVATDRDGVFLTWKDLWVTVSDGKKGSKSILQGLTGYARPGELLAIMGPSGCGKSTLLDTLAGRLGSSTRQTGDILINGHKQRLAFGTSAYVTQDDTLITTLTVKEAVYYSAQLQLPDSMTRAEKKERAEMIIREMGLQDAMNTRIGGWGSKGISGGQKRRVSICIEILTHPKLLFLDEPTSGLDSAASFYVMSRIARLDHKGENTRTVIASIHQPSGEVFQLFDSLCLLSAGKVVYFGSASQANEFFALNGFPCPTLQNPSDHFLKTINKDFETDLEQGLADAITAEVAINTLTKAYKSSDNYQQVKRLVTEICVKDCRTLEERSHSSFLTQCLVLTRRSFVNMYRDLGYYWLRVAIYVSLSLGLATLFYNLGSDNDSIQADCSSQYHLLSWYQSTISEDLLNTILERDSTAENAWNRLKDIFSDNKNSRALYLEQEFSKVQMDDFADASSYCQHLKSLSDQLSNVGAPVSNERLVLQLLSGLTDAYAGVGSQIRHGDTLPLFYKARSMLVLEETARMKRAAQSPSSSAFFVSPGGHSGGHMTGNPHNQSPHHDWKPTQPRSSPARGGRGGGGGARHGKGRGRGGRGSQWNSSAQPRRNFGNGNFGNGYGNGTFGQRDTNGNAYGQRNGNGWAYPPWAGPWQAWAAPPCPYPTAQSQQPTQQGLLGPRPQQAHMAAAHSSAQQAHMAAAHSSAQSSYAPTDIQAAMHTLSIAPPDDQWYMDTGATSHMTANGGFSDGDAFNEM